ncbi:MAG: outer membrane protein assembly factor BamD [Leadbetterella sp.]
MRSISLILFLFIGLGSCNRAFNKLIKKGTTDQKYSAAIKYYKSADYAKAGILFDEVMPLLRGDSTAENAQFYNAYCNYYQGNLEMSSYQFKSFYSTYANSPLAEEAFYMYAFSMFKDAPPYNLDQTTTVSAIDALQTFINTFPNSKYEKICDQNLRDLRYRLELKAYEKTKQYFRTREASFGGRPNYLATSVSVDNFRKDFPDSRFVEELSNVQIIAMSELASLSFSSKQKERYEFVLSFYEKFIDKYPKSKYLKALQSHYDGALSGLEKLKKENDALQDNKNKVKS